MEVEKFMMKRCAWTISAYYLLHHALVVRIYALALSCHNETGCYKSSRDTGNIQYFVLYSIYYSDIFLHTQKTANWDIPIYVVIIRIATMLGQTTKCTV